MSNVTLFPKRKSNRLTSITQPPLDKERRKEWLALKGVLTINEFLDLNYPETTQGKQEELQPYNPFF